MSDPTWSSPPRPGPLGRRRTSPAWKKCSSGQWDRSQVSLLRHTRENCWSWTCPPWRKDNIKRTCAWYIRYFMAKVIWRQILGLKWLDMEWEQREQGQTPWTLKWSMAGWTWGETFSVYVWLTVGTRYPVKWKGLKNARIFERPKNAESCPVAPRLMGKTRAIQPRCERGATRSGCSLRGPTWAMGDDFTSKQVSR